MGKADHSRKQMLPPLARGCVLLRSFTINLLANVHEYEYQFKERFDSEAPTRFEVWRQSFPNRGLRGRNKLSLTFEWFQ